MIKAAKGDTVTVRYIGRLDDGTVFDASPAERPLQFILGRGEVIPGFDEGIAGMFQGESRTFRVLPEKAYGAHEAKYVETVDRTALPAGITPQVGRQLQITGQSGNRLLVLITEVTETTLTLDGNHPLAGRELTFEVELLEVKKDLPRPNPMTMGGGAESARE